MFYFLKIWNICGHWKLVSCLCAILSLNESILKKSFQKSFSHLKDKIGILWKTSKTTSFWRRIVTKPLDLQLTTRHQWKDNAHIFHLAPLDLKYVQFVHPLGHSCLVKIKGPLRLVGKLSDTSISSSLSLYLFTLPKSLSLPRYLVWLQSQVYPMVHQFNHINPFQSAVWDH